MEISMLSTASLLLFAVLATRRLTWSWAAAALSVILPLVPWLMAGGMGMGLTVLWADPTAAMIVAVAFGWWNWHRRSRDAAGAAIQIRRADRRHYAAAGLLLLGIALLMALPVMFQDSLSTLPALQLPWAVLGFLVPGLHVVTLLGFGLGLLESWWLLLAGAVMHLVNLLLPLVVQMGPGAAGLDVPLVMVALNAALIVVAIRGHRAWRDVRCRSTAAMASSADPV